VKSENTVKAVEMMRKIRDQIAGEEKGLSWEERQEKRRRELENDLLWKRFQDRLVSQSPSETCTTRREGITR
jgi:hypothetical protein